MRRFILGLALGVLAVYLWERGRGRLQRNSELPDTRVPEPDPSTQSVSEAAEIVDSGSEPAPMEYSRSSGPSYQTAPLAEYGPQHQALAEQLFDAAGRLVGRRVSKKCEGSYSFLSKTGSTAAKIIIYERQHGKQNGAFPMLQNGVYVLLRTQGSAPNTLGVAPKHEERFYYRRVNETDLDGAAEEIAEIVDAAR